jgi:hypothetical protein
VDRMVALVGFFLENLVLIFSLFVVLELVFCYALQAIADKQGLPNSWMAWVPLLQLYPLIRAGSSSFQPFLLLLGAGIAAALANALLGPLGFLLTLAWGAWALVYFVRLCWNTAESRGVSGWIGLLVFLPLINLIVYLYIAFHDGPLPPSTLGLLLGVVFIVLPAVPEIRKAQQIAEFGSQFGPMWAAAEQGDEDAMRRMLHEMTETMQGMEGSETRGGGPDGMSKVLARLASAMGRGGESEASEREDAVSPASEVPELASVSAFFTCPEGTRERGEPPPSGFERWCERLDPASGRVRHGGYASWHRNHVLHETGLYRNGDRVGVWTRWYPSGKKQAQAEFQDGRQHGFQIDWDESGRRLREIRFVHGEPVGR